MHKHYVPAPLPRFSYSCGIVAMFLVASMIAAPATGQLPSFQFDWSTVSGDLDFTKPVHSAFSFTKVYGGLGTVTCLQDLPGIASVAGNPPLDLEFVFGSGDSLATGEPALTLSGFNNDGMVVIQEFTATEHNHLEVFNQGVKVANGRVLDITTLTPPSLVSTGFGRFQLTDDGGGDPTLFNEILALSNNTGIMSFGLSTFEFSGTGFDPALFSAEGIGAPGTPPGLTPENPLLPSAPTGIFVFDIPSFSECGRSPILFIDPVVTIGYDYEATGTTFASVLLPDLGDGLYDLYLWDGNDYVYEDTLVAGTEFEFDGAGVDRFRILGIDESLGLDPTDPVAFVTGISLTSTDAASVSMTPIVIPEPTSLATALLALSILGSARRRS